MADEFQLFKRKADADECSIHSESDLQSTSSWEIVSENELWSDFETSADDDDSTDRNVSEKTIDKDDVDTVKETFNVSSVLRLISLSEQTSGDDDSTDRNFSEETTNNDDLTDRNVSEKTIDKGDDVDTVKETFNVSSVLRLITLSEQTSADDDTFSEKTTNNDDFTDRNVSEKTIDKDDVDIVKETFNVSSVLRLITLSEQTSADDDSTDRNFSEETTNNDDLTDRNVCSDNDDFDIVKVTDNFAKSLSRDTTFYEQFIGDKDSTGSKMNPLPVMVIQLLLPLAFVMLCNVMSCFM